MNDIIMAIFKDGSADHPQLKPEVVALLVVAELLQDVSNRLAEINDNLHTIADQARNGNDS